MPAPAGRRSAHDEAKITAIPTGAVACRPDCPGRGAGLRAGLGAGLGAYVGWMNLTAPRYLIFGSLVLVMLGGIVGSYIGLVYGQNVDPNYLGRSYAIESGLHFGAATGAILVSTALGLFNEIKTKGR